MDQAPKDRFEIAVRHSIGSLMGGRASLESVIERLNRQGFKPEEIKTILDESSRRMSAVAKIADQDFYNTSINTGLMLLALAIGVVALVGYPENGRGVGIFYTAVIGGIGALIYGVSGKFFTR